MAKIIDFKQKMEERTNICINSKAENVIVISGHDGEIRITLNIPKKKTRLRNIIIGNIKNRIVNTNMNDMIKEISEAECKEIFDCCKNRISWKYGYVEEQWEREWLKIEETIFNCNNFQYETIMENTYMCSYIYCVKRNNIND